MLHPVLDAKTLNPSKLSYIVRDQCQSVTSCMRCDMQIIDTNDHTFPLEIGTDVSMLVSRVSDCRRIVVASCNRMYMTSILVSNHYFGGAQWIVTFIRYYECAAQLRSQSIKRFSLRTLFVTANQVTDIFADVFISPMLPSP